jgi:hypothetical protein
LVGKLYTNGRRITNHTTDGRAVHWCCWLPNYHSLAS